MIRQVVILAGGSGTRLASVTGSIPKSLVLVGDKPVLQHQLELAATFGATDVRIFGGYLADQIIEFVGDGSRFGLRVTVEVESQPLGNAGAVLQKLDLLDDQFLVLYGDLMAAVDLSRFSDAHTASSAAFTVFVHPNDHPQDSDLVEVNANNHVTRLHLKPHPEGRFFRNLVNAALYGIRREALRSLPQSHGKQDFMKHVLPSLLTAGRKILAYRSTEYVKDMGTPDRLEHVRQDWKAGRIRVRSATDLVPAIFLDRDGTLNQENGFIHSPSQLTVYPRAAQALRRLRSAGYRLIVLTNQPVIARGEATQEEVDAIHSKLEWELGKSGAYLDGIYICPHHPDKGFPGERSELKGLCECRKPSTGLLVKACQELAIDPANSWMIGDTTSDLEMARRGGLRSILVQTGVAGRDGKYSATPDHTAADLDSAAEFVLSADHARAAVATS